MSDEAAFLTAITAAPDDNTARLVYADWLDEHGRTGGSAKSVRGFLSLFFKRDGARMVLIATTAPVQAPSPVVQASAPVTSPFLAGYDTWLINGQHVQVPKDRCRNQSCPSGRCPVQR